MQTAVPVISCRILHQAILLKRLGEALHLIRRPSDEGENIMKVRTLMLVAAFALSSSLAFAAGPPSGAAGSGGTGGGAGGAGTGGTSSSSGTGGTNGTASGSGGLSQGNENSTGTGSAGK